MFLKTLVLTLSFLTSIRLNHVNLPVQKTICFTLESNLPHIRKQFALGTLESNLP